MKLLTLTIIILIVILQDSIFIWKINKLNGENWFFKHETLEKSFGMALCPRECLGIMNMKCV